MITIDSSVIQSAIAEIIPQAATRLTADTEAALNAALLSETNPITRFALSKMCENATIASKTNTPVCQDTGLCVVFIDIGHEVFITGEPLNESVELGVREGYTHLRKSVCGALSRVNTRDNTPPIIHTRIVRGDNIKLSVMLKGFGSENMSKLHMLMPSAGLEGVKSVIIDTARAAGSNPCPPIIIGVGIGGDMEQACIMAKRSLLRELGSTNPDSSLVKLESELLASVNNLNIGAQGLGGKTTCLGLFIEECPTHISSIPVAVNIQCHASRHKTIIIRGEL